jgi:transcription elongation factor Elf1
MFLWGGKKNEAKKIEGGFEERLRNTIRGQLCPICGKNQSSKVAFGEEVAPSLTCNNCELKAVGSNIQKLGPKNLMASDKFSNLLTAELIAYQKGQAEPPVAHKENPTLAQVADKQAREVSSTIKTELYSLREQTKAKAEELALEADKQNAIPIFDDTLRLFSEKKNIGEGFINEAIKRSLVGTKGLHFVNH